MSFWFYIWVLKYWFCVFCLCLGVCLGEVLGEKFSASRAFFRLLVFWMFFGGNVDFWMFWCCVFWCCFYCVWDKIVFMFVGCLWCVVWCVSGICVWVYFLFWCVLDELLMLMVCWMSVCVVCYVFVWCVLCGGVEIKLWMWCNDDCFIIRLLERRVFKASIEDVY